MQRLAYVELDHFRSFRRKARIEFPEKGLMRLRGRNKDTGGESGAGKSTVAHAITFCIGKCPYPSTELATWGTEHPLDATLGFRDGTSIERGKKFSITDSTGTVKGSAAQKEEYITKLFGGLDVDMILALTYRGQRKPGLFLSKTDSQKKEFLTRLLGLNKFESNMEEGAKTISALQALVDRATATYDAISKSISELGVVPDVASLIQKEIPLKIAIEAHNKKIAALRTESSKVKEEGEKAAKEARESFTEALDEARKRIQNLQAPLAFEPVDTTALDKFKVVIAQCKDRISRLVSEDMNRKSEVEQQINALSARINGLERAAAAASGLLRDKARLNLEFESLVSDICPTCKREWDKAIDRRFHIEDELLQIGHKLDQCVEQQGKANELRAELDQLPKFEPNPLIDRLQKAQSDARASAATEQQKIDSAHGLQESERKKIMAEVRAELAVLSSNAEQAAAEASAQTIQRQHELAGAIEKEREVLSEVQLALTDLGQAIFRGKTLKEQYDRLQQQAGEARSERESHEVKLHAEKDFLALIGREGFLGLIFSEVLAEISDETNQLLASVANTRHCTLRFTVESTTQKGTVTKEIKPLVTIGGFEAPINSGLSGGMFSVVELAVDLALGAVISRRSGVCPGYLILDESFDGLGAVEKDSALEILQRYAQDRLVIVIDHTSELQGSFTNTLTIDYQDGKSWICKDPKAEKCACTE